MDEARLQEEAGPGPLAGLRVLGVTKVWSGPLATCVLGDLGADVISVELPEARDGLVPPAIPGSRLSWFRQSVHRNKRSVALDLRTPEGRASFLRLVTTADAVVENYRPGTLDSWGVGYADCCGVRPDLVFASISGFGQYGPRAQQAAYDPVVQAAGGWMAANGLPDGPPVRAPTFIADELAGLHTAIAVLAALAHRDRTGEGQHIDISMLDCLLSASSGLPTLAAAGAPPPRLGNETDFVAPCNVYACADGHLYLAVALNKHWRALTEIIGVPELARATGYRTNEERLANRASVNALVAGWCAHRPVAEAVAALAERGLVVTEVRSLADAVADPQVVARRMLLPTRLSDGTVAPLVAPPAKFSRTPTTIRRPAPEAGADTEEVLAELDAITEGRSTGVKQAHPNNGSARHGA